VLDVVTHIQRDLDPTLAYRFACRVGMCGSCAMTVNGARAGPAARTWTRWRRTGALSIAPLRNLPVIRDLAADMREFFDKWARAKRPVHRHAAPARTIFAKVAALGRAPQADAGIECIGCGVCYSSCDVVEVEPRLPRSGGAQPRVDAGERRARHAGRPSGCARWRATPGAIACHTHMSCTERCPKAICADAGDRGAQARGAARAALKGEL
jgi:fumarate reductase iron-sulfur subunit